MGRMSSEIFKKSCSATSLQLTEGADEVVNCQPSELDSLPLSVKHELLEIGGSVELLKTCRFLSKSWNEICCRILRKVSAVPLNETEEDGADMNSFKDLLLNSHERFPSDWPNPFQNLSLLQAPCSNPSLVCLAERQNMTITTLDIVHNDKFNPGNFEKILELHKDSIIHLKLRENANNSTPFTTIGEKLGSGWRSLKSLTLVDTCLGLYQPCSHMNFIIELTGRTSIQKLTLDGNLYNTTRIFAEPRCRWDKLNSLELKSEKPVLIFRHIDLQGMMKWTRELKFPALTNIMLWFLQPQQDDQRHEEIAERYTPYLLPLIQERSAVLKSLRVSFMRISAVPNCPRLRELSCALLDGDRIQDFTELRFPSLISVYPLLCWKEVPLYTDPKEGSRNRMLTSFKVSPLRNSAQEALETLWSSLRDYFPNLKTLDILPTIYSPHLNLIRQRLPQLENLTIAFIYYPKDLLGTLCGPATSVKGWPPQDIGNSALLELPELTHLTLGTRVFISREALVGCLGRLPRIQFLSFFWNRALEAVDVPKYLGHIPNVTIFNANAEQRQKLMSVGKGVKGLQLKRCRF